QVGPHDVDLSAHHVAGGLGIGLVGHVHDLDVGQLLVQFAASARGGAAPAESELARALPGQFGEVGHAVDRQLVVGHQHEHALGDAGDGGEVLDVIVWNLGEQTLVGGVRGVRADQHGVAVGLGIGDVLGGDHAACAG